MQVENPRRLIVFLVAIVAILFAGYWFLLKGDGDAPQEFVQTAPTNDVQAIFTATSKVDYIQMVSSGGPAPKSKTIVDGKKGVSATYSDGKLVVLQTKDTIYQMSAKCYFKTASPKGGAKPSVQTIAMQLLPYGSSTIKYTDPVKNGDFNSLTWTNTPPGKGGEALQAKGTVMAGVESNLIKSAALKTGNLSIKYKVTYPKDAPSIPVPTNICK